MGRYRWVYHGQERLFDVGILPDGTLRNPRGYPEDLVREAVLAADARRHERRSQAAKQAAVTRSHRQQQRVIEVAKRILAGHNIGPRSSCTICGRGLDDPQSIERGIGSECWQGALQALDAVERQIA